MMFDLKRLVDGLTELCHCSSMSMDMFDIVCDGHREPTLCFCIDFSTHTLNQVFELLRSRNTRRM